MFQSPIAIYALALACVVPLIAIGGSTDSVAATYAAHAKSNHPKLETFFISDDHLPTHESRVQAGKAIIAAIERDSIIQISIEGIAPPDVIKNAFKAQQNFFDLPISTKMQAHNDLSYAGYVYSGEEETAGKRDAAEIFTVTRDYDLHDSLVEDGVPCHGPVPWPSDEFKTAMTVYSDSMRSVGDRVLPLIALGLGMEETVFQDVTGDSWGHMRVLKFREKSTTDMPGIGSHTDYGMLVLASQDEVGGLWVRPHTQGEERKNNWDESNAGDFEENDGWKFVVPEPDVLTCFPGDMLQFITNGRLMSTPHKVELADRIRYAIAYFHEPSFGAVIKRDDVDESVHYGTHFTNMFKRCYPEKGVTKRIVKENLEANLKSSITGVHTF